MNHVLQQCQATGSLMPEVLVHENLVSDWEVSRVSCELYHLPFLTVDLYPPGAAGPRRTRRQLPAAVLPGAAGSLRKPPDRVYSGHRPEPDPRGPEHRRGCETSFRWSVPFRAIASGSRRTCPRKAWLRSTSPQRSPTTRIGPTSSTRATPAVQLAAAGGRHRFLARSRRGTGRHARWGREFAAGCGCARGRKPHRRRRMRPPLPRPRRRVRACRLRRLTRAVGSSSKKTSCPSSTRAFSARNSRAPSDARTARGYSDGSRRSAGSARWNLATGRCTGLVGRCFRGATLRSHPVRSLDQIRSVRAWTPAQGSTKPLSIASVRSEDRAGSRWTPRAKHPTPNVGWSAAPRRCPFPLAGDPGWSGSCAVPCRPGPRPRASVCRRSRSRPPRSGSVRSEPSSR